MTKRGLLLVGTVMLIMMFTVACGSKEVESKWKDGSYNGLAEGVHGDIELSVVIKEGKITSIDVIQQGETSGVSEVAFAEVPKAIIEAQSTEVDTVTGATVSSQAIIDAVNAALESAK